MEDNLCSSNISLSSESVYDFSCTTCARQQKNSEAINYCKTCAEYFCVTCIEFHKTFPALNGHRDEVIGQDEMKNIGRQKVRDLLTETCNDHGGKVVELYCYNHDKIGCVTCITLNHRACCNVDYIPRVVDAINTDGERNHLKLEVDSVMSAMLKIKEKRKKDKDRINKEKNEAISSISEFRNKLDEYLDRLETNAKEELNEKYDQYEKDINEDLARCDCIIDSAEKLLDTLRKDDETKSQTFINIKNTEKKLRAFKPLTEKFEGRKFFTLRFEANTKVTEYLKNLGDIGTFSHPQNVYVVTGNSNISIKIKEDPWTCGKLASCQLSDGTILSIDCSGKKLKRLDSKYDVIEAYHLPNHPIAVCCTRKNEAALVLDSHVVQCFTVTENMEMSNTFALEHAGYGLAFTDGNLYISDGNKCIYVYDLSGKRISVFQVDASGEDIFTSAGSIAASADGEHIYVTDLQKGVLALDKQGNVNWTLTHPDLQNAYGVCCDKYNNIFVCGNWSHNVIQVNSDGHVMGILLDSSDGVQYPTSVLFDHACSNLLVFMGARDFVKVFQLQHLV